LRQRSALRLFGRLCLLQRQLKAGPIYVEQYLADSDRWLSCTYTALPAVTSGATCTTWL